MQQGELLAASRHQRGRSLAPASSSEDPSGWPLRSPPGEPPPSGAGPARGCSAAAASAGRAGALSSGERKKASHALPNPPQLTCQTITLQQPSAPHTAARPPHLRRQRASGCQAWAPAQCPAMCRRPPPTPQAAALSAPLEGCAPLPRGNRGDSSTTFGFVRRRGSPQGAEPRGGVRPHFCTPMAVSPSPKQHVQHAQRTLFRAGDIR